MKVLVFYVVESHIEKVKEAIFKAQGGESEHFEQCSWQTLGDGQYKEKTQTDLVKNPEYKVEILCEDTKIKHAIKALLESHPCDHPPHYVLSPDS